MLAVSVVEVIKIIMPKVGNQRPDETKTTKGRRGDVPLPPRTGKLGGVRKDGNCRDTRTEAGLVGHAVIEEGGGNGQLPVDALPTGVSDGGLDVLLVNNLRREGGESTNQDGVQLNVGDRVALLGVGNPWIPAVMMSPGTARRTAASASGGAGSVVGSPPPPPLSLGDGGSAFATAATSTIRFVVAITVTILIISQQGFAQFILAILPVIILQVVNSAKGKRIDPLPTDDTDGIPRNDPTAKDDAIESAQITSVGRPPYGVGGGMLKRCNQPLDETGIVANVIERIVGIGIR
mmetsp:Transcript_8864/g.18773  ORF Transcript_8864/g.18773 Transcript_8864/m.18773 type:complete len:292 (-) Transcript_8864:820-1695(-)